MNIELSYWEAKCMVHNPASTAEKDIKILKWMQINTFFFFFFLQKERAFLSKLLSCSLCCYLRIGSPWIHAHIYSYMKYHNQTLLSTYLACKTEFCGNIHPQIQRSGMQDLITSLYIVKEFLWMLLSLCWESSNFYVWA